MPKVTKSVTAENQFTPELEFDAGMRMFNISISGTFVATITVQRSFDNGVTWLDVKQFTVPAQEIGEHIELGVRYRLGVKTGDFTSGTAEVRLSY